MAQSYTISSFDTTFASDKCMLGVFNGSGSGRIVRIYRIWMLNNQPTAVVGALTHLELRRFTAGSGGTPITPFKHDSNNEAFPSQVVVSTNMIFTPSDLLKRFIWSTDEPNAANNPTGAITIDEAECWPAMNLVWDASYGGSDVEPIVCREGYGLGVVNVGTLTGLCDIFFEVTLEAT